MDKNKHSKLDLKKGCAYSQSGQACDTLPMAEHADTSPQTPHAVKAKNGSPYCCLTIQQRQLSLTHKATKRCANKTNLFSHIPLRSFNISIDNLKSYTTVYHTNINRPEPHTPQLAPSN